MRHITKLGQLTIVEIEKIIKSLPDRPHDNVWYGIKWDAGLADVLRKYTGQPIINLILKDKP